MTYLELEQKLKQAQALLQRAHDTIDIHEPNNGILSEIKAFLAPPPKPEFAGIGSRLEGEECGICKHSSTYHAAGGKGICSKVDCECMKFKPTGRANTQAR